MLENSVASDGKTVSNEGYPLKLQLSRLMFADVWPLLMCVRRIFQ